MSSEAADPPGSGPFADNRSETAEVLRRVDWSSHPLGPVETWPVSLRTAVGIVLDSPAMKVMTWGREENFTFYNDAFVPFLGPARIHGIGRPYPEYRPAVWPVIKPFVEAGLAGSPKETVQMRAVVRRTGEEDFGHFAITFTPVRDDDGAIAGVMGELVETTAHVQLQNALEAENRRHRELFDQAPVFMALTGAAPDYVVQYTNRAFQKLVGGREIIGQTTAEALPELGPQGFLALMDQAFDSGEPLIGWNVPFNLLNAPDGSPELHYLDFIYQPIVSADGQVTGILCAGSDVTERHIAREKAEKLQRDLHHVSRMSAMGTMAATIAHELSQPLTAAGNYLAGCDRMIDSLDGGDKDSLKGALERAGQQIRRAGEIIRRARDTASSDRAPHDIVSLQDLVVRSLELLDVTEGCAGVDIRTELSPDAMMVCVDPVQGEQVLLNLIRNACQAMEGSSRRELGIASRKLDDGYAEITIADTGRGLPPGDVFAAFAQSTTGGLGLGLSLSRTLIEGHGGTMWARNNPDGGATFHFTLPMREAIEMEAREEREEP
jgi:two-component system sensor kinase FixL